MSKAYIKKPYCLTDFADNAWLDMKNVNALQLPFAESSLDFIISSNMIHHLAKPYEFFKEAKRVLKPQGKIIIQEIHTSFFMRLILRLMRHEGYSYEVDVFDKNTICNDPNDLWSANCAIPEILFNDAKKFRQNFGFEIKDRKFSEFMIFPLSGGVIAKAKTIQLPTGLLKIIDSIDSLLCKIAPNIFALQNRLVLYNEK